MKRGAFDLSPAYGVDREEIQRHLDAIPTPGMTLDEVMAALAAVTDRLDELGDPRATLIRRAAGLPSEPNQWTAEWVAMKCGLDVERMEAARKLPCSLDGHRQSGRTTAMMCEAVAAAGRGIAVEVTTHSPSYNEELAYRGAEMLRQCGAAATIVEAFGRRTVFGGGLTETIQFVDHFEKELRVRDPRRGRPLRSRGLQEEEE